MPFLVTILKINIFLLQTHTFKQSIRLVASRSLLYSSSLPSCVFSSFISVLNPTHVFQNDTSPKTRFDII